MNGRRRVTHGGWVLGLALGSGLPALLVAVVLLWRGGFSARVHWTLLTVMIGSWLGLTVMLHERVVRSLQTLSALLAALREGDFSLRGRGARPDDDLGVALLEANALGEVLRAQRLGALEATALLRAVLDEIGAAVLALDGQDRVLLCNRAAERLLGQQALLGREAAALGLAACLDRDGAAARTVQLDLPGGGGPYEVRRGTIRLEGRAHRLLVLTDLRRALREEERQAWQRLVRVLGHEINNSLAPIHSIASNLLVLLQRRAGGPVGPAAPALPDDYEEDLAAGLQVIARRAEALGRFLASYALLARLPPPRRQPLAIAPLVQRVAALEKRLPVEVAGGPELVLHGDGDQIEQLLINLVRNGVDAALQTGGGVRLSWRRAAEALEVLVEDEGPGPPETGNLFVPFFTTKPQGSGIGLVLSRQIAEAHHGSLSLHERRCGRGCEARLRLPLGD